MTPSGHRSDEETPPVPHSHPAEADSPGPAPEHWWAFRGPAALPEPPPWRRFPSTQRTRPQHYLMDADEIAVVNAALQLRRPLLVTGRPGTGKSSLARAVADDLGLGEVLRWPVNSRSTLADALYRYDAVGRLREASLQREREPLRGSARRLKRRTGNTSDIGNYLRLGPLGTALAATAQPRVLLIDELDKSDIDLPNDLLVVLEEGEFEIPELARLPEHQQTTDVLVTGSRDRIRVQRGVVSCTHFPIVVMTSNGEREFPPAFLRRCVRLDLRDPDEEKLRDIVRHNLGEEALAQADDLIETFLSRQAVQSQATDQLLAAVHLRVTGADLSRDELLGAVMHRLDEAFPA
ncbi:AAA family ATPase [Streptomyces boluensis]|uniref:AAA family ATPase n=1 Tax=Streptomyces boluensis TaxID=1775135 RepID=A0A964UJC8_9ACTN|nr:MoxR family ATPase [Streptomyces boluensis]NBE50164.1 AAA family ATPase [Streptomyces boluensis]